jgi:hypothetical protein
MKAKEKQINLLKLMMYDLDTEFDCGGIKFTTIESLSIQQASFLIGLNKDLYFLCVDEGQCTPRNYNILKYDIYGVREQKMKRNYLSNWQVLKFINKRRVKK